MREIRKYKGFSHENMAIELNMSTSAYNKLERCETTLSLERFLKILEILNTPITEIFQIIESNENKNIKEMEATKIENLYQENKKTYEKLLASKDDQIALLKTLLEMK